MRADLHIHSEYSYDSYETIESIIEKAKENNIDFIAVCDHDAIEGSKLLLKQNDISCISGIEIDCFFKSEVIHILGYGCDLSDERFKQIETNYTSELNRCSDTLISMMESYYHIHMDKQKIIDYSKGKPVTHVAITEHLLSDFKHEELIPYQIGEKAGSPIANYYWDYLAIGKLFYLPKKIPNAQEIIQLIHETKGVAIIAHPFVNIGCNRTAAIELLEMGADGFEVYCSYHKQEQVQFFHELCMQLNCLETAGSDYHGNIKPNVLFGMTNYEGDCDKMIEALMKRVRR